MQCVLQNHVERCEKLKGKSLITSGLNGAANCLIMEKRYYVIINGNINILVKLLITILPR